MSLGYGILGFLNYGRMSGYDIVKAFDSSLKFFWHAQNSHIYLELKKLEKKGYISGETVVQNDRPNKRLFTITDEGRKAFMDWLAEDVGKESVQFKSAFMMKVFFGGSLPPAQGIEILKSFRKDCMDYLESMSAIPDSISAYGANKESCQSLYWAMTADFGYSFINTCIDWAGRCIEKLEKLNSKTLPQAMGDKI